MNCRRVPRFALASSVSLIVLVGAATARAEDEPAKCSVAEAAAPLEHDAVLAPGVMTTIFAPSAGLGAFYGAGVQLSLYEWWHANDSFGPSQGALYMQASLLGSTRAPGALALFELGANASFERNVQRHVLVPYFGTSFGVLAQSQIGTAGYVYPNVGIHIVRLPSVIVDAEAGYHFAFQEVDEAHGPRAILAARFSFW